MSKAPKYLLPALLCLTPGNILAAERITAEVEAKPAARLSAEESRAVSLAAAEIIKHVNGARAALGKNDAKAAGRHVDQGLLLVRIISESVPEYKVETKIKAGALSYSDSEGSRPRIVPIYEELQRIAVMAPVEAAKKEAQKEAAKSGVPVAVDVELVHTRTDLNVELAQIGLQEAKEALDKNDSKAADAALATVQTGVIFGYAKMDLPLDKVRENLVLAKSLVDAGKSKEAHAALDVASDALNEYEKGAGEKRAKDAKDLRAEIEKLAKNIETNSQGASQQILGWWDKVRKWLK